MEAARSSFLLGDFKFGSMEFDFGISWVRVGGEGELLDGCCCEHEVDGLAFTELRSKA